MYFCGMSSLEETQYTFFFFSRVCQHSAQCAICTNIYIHRNQPVPCCSDTLLMVKHCRD